MKKQLQVKGSFIHGVFIPETIKVPSGAVRENGKSFKSGWARYTQTRDATCGGKEKPPAKDDMGAWLCIEDEWVWFPG